MQLERQRLAFVEHRDGTAAMQTFAARTYQQYRAALRTDYGKAYRRQLIESCVVFREVVR
jgi:hypothetical protein